jgi:AmiR/NasT family two-component response regulator
VWGTHQRALAVTDRICATSLCAFLAMPSVRRTASLRSLRNLQELCQLASVVLRSALLDNGDPMTTALLCAPRPVSLPSLAADLAAAGLELRATEEDCSKLVQAVVRHAPDVVVCDIAQPTRAWFQALQRVQQTAPRPVVWFTQDPSADHMAQAVAAGVDAYVVQGYGANRLLPLVHLAQARHRAAQAQQLALEEATTRLDERKSVDRAKGILMRDGRLSDDDAFAALRSAAMRNNLRMGQLSQQLIQSAQHAEAINRAGQLRMLSQRLLVLQLLEAHAAAPADQAGSLEAAVQRVQANLAFLRKNLSQSTYGDWLDGLDHSWTTLQQALAQSDSPALDRAAEALLQGAERLTASLERAAATNPLQVLNLAGRQRMLSQRYAKCVLLAAAHPELADLQGLEMQQVRTAFEAALTYLNGIPLSTPEIAETLLAAGVAWLHLVNAAQALSGLSSRPPGVELQAVGQHSDTLLALFEQLSNHYANSLQLLVG